MEISLRNLVAEGEVHPTLRLGDTRQDTVQILTRLLDILAVARLVELERLQDVARLPLIADAHGDDVQFRERLDLIRRLTHAEHLDDALIRLVLTVLRTSVALSDPHALPLLGEHIADILAEVLRRHIEVLHVAATLHTEHLVGLADIDHQRRRHQVGTESDLRRLVPVPI